MPSFSIQPKERENMQLKSMKSNFENKDINHFQIVYVFDNGFEVSIISGKDAYTSMNAPFEVGIFDANKEFTRIFFPVNHSNSVFGYQTWDEVNTILNAVETYKPLLER